MATYEDKHGLRELLGEDVCFGDQSSAKTYVTLIEDKETSQSNQIELESWTPMMNSDIHSLLCYGQHQ